MKQNRFAIVVAALLALALPAWAPDDKPEKLNLGGLGYDSTTGSFVIELSAHLGIAIAAERARFSIDATLHISDRLGNPVETVFGSAPVRRTGSAGPRGMVPLEPVRIEWDRVGGTFSGVVDVEVTARMTKNGRPVANATATGSSAGIIIPPDPVGQAPSYAGAANSGARSM